MFAELDANGCVYERDQKYRYTFCRDSDIYTLDSLGNVMPDNEAIERDYFSNRTLSIR